MKVKRINSIKIKQVMEKIVMTQADRMSIPSVKIGTIIFQLDGDDQGHYEYTRFGWDKRDDLDEFKDPKEYMELEMLKPIKYRNKRL